MKIKEFMRSNLFDEVLWYNIARRFHRHVFKTQTVFLLIIQILLQTFFSQLWRKWHKIFLPFFYFVCLLSSRDLVTHICGESAETHAIKPVFFLTNESKNSWMSSQSFHFDRGWNAFHEEDIVEICWVAVNGGWK
jgi:hypothetical protein